MWWIESNLRKPAESFSPPVGNSPIVMGNLRDGPGALRHMPTLGAAAYAYGVSNANSASSTPPDLEQQQQLEAIRGFSSRVQNPTTRLTRAQLVYLFLMQAVPSMVIAGVINFAAGYPMYASPRPPPGHPPEGSIPPFLFRPPVSLVADAFFTTFIQSAITWVCLAVFVNRAMSRGEVAPYVCRSDEPRNALVRWFFMLDHYNAQRGSRLFGFCCCCYGAKGGRVQRFARWIAFGLAGLGRSLIAGVLGFLIMIGPTIGVCAAAGTKFDGDWVFLGRWDGALFKLVYGGVLGFIMSPALAFMWMVRAGWIVNRHVMV